MSELNLDEIRANAEWYRVNREGRQGAVEAYPWCAAAINCAEDVPALLAEVERLRSNVERTREWVRVADAEDVTDWQRGYRACSDRALHALAGESDG